jgi:hypothetical protein
LADFDQLFFELGDAHARLFVAVDAAAAIVAQRVLEQAPLDRILDGAQVDRGQALKHLAVERELGAKRRELALELFAGFANRLVGVHLREQVYAPGNGVGFAANRVERFGQLGGRGGRIKRLERSLCGARSFERIAAILEVHIALEVDEWRSGLGGHRSSLEDFESNSISR